MNKEGENIILKNVRNVNFVWLKNVKCETCMQVLFIQCKKADQCQGKKSLNYLIIPRKELQISR